MNHPITGSPVISIKVTERSSIISFKMPPNGFGNARNMEDLGMSDVFGTTNSSSSVNWSAAVRKII